jgi:hypothetical protein
MTIISRQFPREVEMYIISFLPSKDQVVLSGVHQRAYIVLSNDSYFKDLLQQKYPSLKNGAPIEKKFENLYVMHPNNCWKVACCVLQTGRVMFNQEFLDEEMGHITEEKNKCEARIREICGECCEDPSSPIQQAWIAYKEQDSIFESYYSEKEKYYGLLEQIFAEHGEDKRIAFLASLDSAQDSKEKRRSIIANFNEKLIPVCDFREVYMESLQQKQILYSKYQQLENEWKKNLDAIASLHKRSPSEAKTALLANPLYQHLKEQIKSLPQGAGDPFYEAFKMWAHVAYDDLLTALESLTTSHPALMQEVMQEMQRRMLSETLFWDIIDQCASNPIEGLQRDMDSIADRIHGFFNQIPKEKIQELLLQN